MSQTCQYHCVIKGRVSVKGIFMDFIHAHEKTDGQGYCYEAVDAVSCTLFAGTESI
jgi:nucleoid-associated protein YejK